MVTVEQVLPPLLVSEGPHWDHEQQTLYFVNVMDGEIHRYHPATKKHTKVTIEGEVVSIVIPIKGQKNKFVITMRRKIAIMTWDGVSSKPSHIETITTVDEEEEKLTNKLCDGKADVNGNLWVGSMSEMDSKGEFPPNKASLFSLSKDRKLTIQLTGITLSNGLTWSLDDKTLYYIDSTTYKVDAFDFDTNKSTLANRRTVFDLKGNGIEGLPDGMTIDTDGNLWLAVFFSGKVLNIDPRTGKLLRTIEVPSSRVTSVAFGGKNLDELYVTSGNIFMTEDEIKANPLAGSLFRIKGTGAKGIPGRPVSLV